MLEENKMRLPRRKALLTTASVSSALIGLSTGAAATGESNGDNYSNENRPSNDDLPPAARENRPDELPATVDDVPDEWMDDEGNFTIPESVLEEEFGVKVYDGKTGEELDDVKTNVVNVDNDDGLATRYGDDVTAQAVRLEETLWSGSAGGISMSLKGVFEINLTGPEISVNLRLQAAGIGFDVISFGITEGDDRLICIEPQTHPTIPLDIAICPDVYWRNGSSKIDVGASGEACVGVSCGWTTCDICRGVSFNATIDISEPSITLE